MLAQEGFLARNVQNLMAKEGERIQCLRHSLNHVAQLVCYRTLWPKKVALHYLGRYLWTYSCMHQTLLQGPDPDSVANTDAFGNRQEPQLFLEPSPKARHVHQSPIIAAVRPS